METFPGVPPSAPAGGRSPTGGWEDTTKGFAVYAIVRAGGRQEKVSVGDELTVDRINAEVGDVVNFAAVLVVDGSNVVSAVDELAKFTITAEILGAVKGPKINIMHYRNKTGYKRRMGHRQPLTQVKVTGISTK